MIFPLRNNNNEELPANLVFPQTRNELDALTNQEIAPLLAFYGLGGAIVGGGEPIQRRRIITLARHLGLRYNN